ncbi:unnamed protein product [Gordionus sp. m RMFG-2023]
MVGPHCHKLFIVLICLILVTFCVHLNPSDIHEAIAKGASFNNLIRDHFTSLVYDKSIRDLTIREFTYPLTPFTIYGEIALEYSFVANHMKALLKGKLNKYEIGPYLLSLNISSTTLARKCKIEKHLRIHTCNKYERELDGFCNNIKTKHWGMSNMPHKRLIEPDYGDGLNNPRIAKNGEALPNPRLITKKVFGNDDKFHNDMTIMTMTFGQFIDHDLTQTPAPTGRQSPKLECCKFRFKHPLCYGMPFPSDDSFFSKFNQTCMNAVRSLPALRTDCKIGPREQMNQVSSYLDGSVLYGSIIEDNLALRDASTPKMKVQPHPFNHLMRELLPAQANLQLEECIYARRARYHCFRAGDERSNENTPLTAMHTIWIREHNRIADWLQHINPHWSAEKGFQTTRKIVGAMLQHISYKEWLPILLGPIEIQKHKLELADTGYFSGYNENIDATIANSFAAAVLRLGHSLINNEFQRIGYLGIYHSSVPLKNTLRLPRGVYLSEFPEGIDPLLRGLVRQAANTIDHNFSEDINDHLFQHENKGFGMDLLALNIHRGRDHGIPAYNEFRDICGLNRFNDWDSMKEAMPSDVVERMRALYNDVDDVDLFPGGISEYHADGAEIGPTFACLLGDQFFRLRFGDRFWYENANRSDVIEHAFLPAQLQELRKASLAKVLCQNSDSITIIQKNVFRKPSFNNPLLTCKDLPDIDLAAWRERGNS